MIFKRSIYNKLLAWKEECQGSRAILVEGARRIGKSTIVREFAMREYKSFIFIDFFKAGDEVKQYFIKYANDLDTLFMMLSVTFNVTLYPRESVIVFDEIQFFPQARGLIKYLVADGRYDYIETGSLISIRENVKNIIIPSEERRLRMYPLDFPEFCRALGENHLIDYIRSCWAKKIPLETALHERALLLFEQYVLIGGMPQSILAFLENDRSFSAADIQKRDILSLYRSDIMRVDARYRAKVLAIFDRIPGLLSSHEKRVVFSSIKTDSKSDQYEETFFWLSDSMIANECRRVTDPQVGLSLTESESYLKCYLGDTGLLVSHAFSENELTQNEIYREILSGKLNINKGMLYENAIAQMLTANGHRLFFYTHYDPIRKRNDIEIDFVLSNNSKTAPRITPIEVKSGRSYSTVSLNRFCEKYNERIDQALIIHPKNLTVKEAGLAIPPYMSFCL